ncbi:MAG: GyrI-like domain-containing protein [Campylobacterales bacterium]|nr:GyrI-like domain-containing protein [Campylobacterales bacterium]
MSFHDEFLIIEKEIGYVVEIQEQIAMWKMPTTIENDLKIIYNYLVSKEQHENIGMPYSCYVNINWEELMNKSIWQIFIDLFKYKWDIHVGIPTHQEIDSHNTIQSGFIPKQKYIETIHYGAYQKLGKTYKALYYYAKENNIQLKNTSFEFYHNNPKEVKPHELQTTVMVAIRQS